MRRYRIIAGKLKGRYIHYPIDDQVRPTPSRLKQIAFEWLRTMVEDVRCLDMFAGSGALGFEAISRGANHCTFLDYSKRHIQHIQQQAKHMKIDQQVCCIQARFPDDMPSLQCPYQGVFLDPPFGRIKHQDCIDFMIKKRWLDSNFSWVYCEWDAKKDLVLNHFKPYKIKQIAAIKGGIFTRTST